MARRPEKFSDGSLPLLGALPKRNQNPQARSQAKDYKKENLLRPVDNARIQLAAEDNCILRIIQSICLREPDVKGRLEPVCAKHSHNFKLLNALSIGCDSMQKNSKPIVEAVDRWRDSQLTDVSARMIVFQAFIESGLDVPRHLDRRVHDLYFNPTVEEFQPRTMWSLSNAFKSAFKDLDPIPQFKATGKLAGFLQQKFPVMAQASL